MANFAERIKELRVGAGLTQEQLADKLNAQRMTIIRWERGDNTPSDENLLLLTRLFRVSTLYLLGYTDDRKIVAEDVEENVRREKADEELLLAGYRLLSPEMKKMVHAVVNNAIIIERDKQE